MIRKIGNQEEGQQNVPEQPKQTAPEKLKRTAFEQPKRAAPDLPRQADPEKAKQACPEELKQVNRKKEDKRKIQMRQVDKGGATSPNELNDTESDAESDDNDSLEDQMASPNGRRDRKGDGRFFRIF